MNQSKQKMICVFMPDGGERGLIQLWWQGRHNWVEARGRPFSQWDESEDTAFSRLHDGMLGAHTSVLHTGDVLVVLPKHPDWEFVAQFLEG